MSVGLKLKELRLTANQSQEQIAQLSQCSRVVYNRYENNKRQIPTEMLARLAVYYKVSLDFICDLEDDFGNKIYE